MFSHETNTIGYLELHLYPHTFHTVPAAKYRALTASPKYKNPRKYENMKFTIKMTAHQCK